MTETRQSPPSAKPRTVLSIDGRPVTLQATAPEGAVRLDELLPMLREIDDHLIEGAVAARRDKHGEHVSCAKGCSACCRRQPVPVTPPEAYALARLVDALPETRRDRVRAAFAAAVEQLQAAGLFDVYINRDPDLTREQALATVRRYMDLALACPFLEDDACGIYSERPFVCRQYLVTSPPALCAAPLDNPVKPIAAPAMFATAMLATATELSGRPQYTVPLVLALTYAEAHRNALEQTFDASDALAKLQQALKMP